MNGEIEMREDVERVHNHRKKVRKAIIEAIGPISAYEMARRYEVTRGTIGRILDDELVGAPTGRKPKTRSGAEAREMIKSDYKELTKEQYLERFARALDSLNI